MTNSWMPISFANIKPISYDIAFASTAPNNASILLLIAASILPLSSLTITPMPTALCCAKTTPSTLTLKTFPGEGTYTPRASAHCFFGSHAFHSNPVLLQVMHIPIDHLPTRSSLPT